MPRPDLQRPSRYTTSHCSNWGHQPGKYWQFNVTHMPTHKNSVISWIADTFPGWIKAFPTSRETADGMAQVLMKNTSSLNSLLVPPSPGSSGHQPSNWNLVFQDVPIKNISVLVSHSFTLASSVQPGHFSVTCFLAVITLPMASPIQRTNAIFSASNLPSQLPQGTDA